MSGRGISLRGMNPEPISLTPRPRPAATWKLSRSVQAQTAAKQLDAAQQRVVDHDSGALLVLAGPGTGKTTTLTEAVVARLTAPGAARLQPSEVLVLTFARKAAGEIRERIITRVGGGDVPAVSTFHSLALALVREFDAERLGAVRLLSGPEQELAVREILGGIVSESVVSDKVAWPSTLREALSTRGLTVEIRNAIARAQNLGIGAEELAQAAQASADAEWQAVAAVLDEYLDSIDQQASLDYNELIGHAVSLTQQEHVQAILKTRYRAIYVDEYQDTDPQQIQLLQNLAVPGCILVTVGDPDQSIYGFRGADTRAVRKFLTDFEYLSPKVSVLTKTRRFGTEILDAAYRVINRNALGDFPVGDEDVKAAARQHRKLQTIQTEPGKVEFHEYESATAEAEEVAERIRQLVADNRDTEHPVRFRDIAILVRSGAVSMPTLERALRAADIPVDVSFDDVPLAQEPAVATLLSALEVALNPDRLCEVSTAFELLTSPLCGIARADLRALARALKKQTSDAAVLSDQLVADALLDRRLTAGLDPDVVGDVLHQFTRAQNLFGDAADAVRQSHRVADVLWKMWSATSWPESLRRQALAGSARAGRDLDAVSALFELARSHRSTLIKPFVELVRGLVVAADQIDSGHQPDAVALLTAHRSKGLEWPIVFICGAEEGIWPDVRRRSGLFQPDKIQIDPTSGRAVMGSLPERSQVIAEERRLFFVACTRAQKLLIVTSGTGDAESGRVASRFVHQLMDWKKQPEQQSSETSAAPRYSASGLVAQLRRVATDPNSEQALRDAAVARLAYLASLKDANGRLLVPAAHPDSWWGTVETTESSVAIEDPNKPIYVRGSSLQIFEDCSLSWFMSQRAQASESKSIALSFGTIVHAFAQAINEGKLDPRDTPVIEQMMSEAFEKLQLDAPWSNAREYRDALECIKTFVRWRDASSTRVAGAEVDFRGEWNVTSDDGSTERVTLRGQIDMILVDADGQVYVADLKTNATPAKVEEGQTNKQLGLYQAAVARGLLEEHLGPEFAEPILGGAALVYLRKQAKGGVPTERTQPGLRPDPESGRTWVEEMVATTARRVRAEDYLPTIGGACGYCTIKSSCPLMAEGRPVIS